MSTAREVGIFLGDSVDPAKSFQLKSSVRLQGPQRLAAGHGAEPAGRHEYHIQSDPGRPWEMDCSFVQNHSCSEPRSSWGMSIVGKTKEKIKQGICLAAVVSFSSNH